MDVSLIADATNNLIVYLATIIEIAHYTLVIYGVRNDWDVNKARKQPVATWLMSIACCYGGGMIISVCVGKPALTPLSNNQSVLMMTIVWWHIFYSPKDVIYNLLSWKPAMLVIVLGKEMIRTRKIMKGVKLGRGAFPDSLLICTILGMFGACGGGFVKNAATFVRKQWNHETVKSIHLAIVTKLSLLFSLLYNLQLLGILPISFNTVVLLQLTVMFLISASSKFGVNFDPFHRIEKIITSCVIDYSAYGGAEEEKSPQKKAREEKSPEKKTDSLKKKE
uniref:trimeric intracellular cation channel type B-A-like isoform X4 n=1 Tax=Styela clava TaxID=7725 RepID=UPI00193AD10A|nr:trimeric intracellular cation channel type B-A-like isoform X4 [Styela clava]